MGLWGDGGNLMVALQGYLEDVEVGKREGKDLNPQIVLYSSIMQKPLMVA